MRKRDRLWEMDQVICIDHHAGISWKLLIGWIQQDVFTIRDFRYTFRAFKITLSFWYIICIICTWTGYVRTLIQAARRQLVHLEFSLHSYNSCTYQSCCTYKSWCPMFTAIASTSQEPHACCWALGLYTVRHFAECESWSAKAETRLS